MKHYFETEEYKKAYPFLSSCLIATKWAKERRYDEIVVNGVYIKTNRFDFNENVKKGEIK